MARKPRIDFPGAWHHVMHRGARRAPIFHEDAHCTLFLDILGDVARRFELEIHAYALMSNHYHLLVRSRHGNLSRAIKHLNARYAQRLNRLHCWDGPLLRGRFRSELVRDESHLPYLLAYLHLNPLRAGLITRLDSHGWTSHRAYLGRAAAPCWLVRDHFLQLFGEATALHAYVLALHQGRHTWPEQMSLEHGFLMRAEALADDEAAAARRPGATRFLSVDEALARIATLTGASIEQLKTPARGPRANPARRFAAWALRYRTLLPQIEIGRLLGMSEAQVSHVLSRLDLKTEPFQSWSDVWWEEAQVSSDKS